MAQPDELISIVSLYPVVYRDRAIDGIRIAASTKCRTCNHRSCMHAEFSTKEHRICTEGLSFYRHLWMNEPLVIGGLIHTRRNSIIGGQRRKDLNRLLVEDVDIELAIDNLSRADGILATTLKEAASETVAFLHDIRSSLGLVMSSCESLIAENRGASFVEKLKDANPSLFRLYQAISLLTEQLGLADLISNPESISYGKRMASDVYQFFHKMVKLFQPKASARHISIKLEGNIYDKVDLFNSFQLVPLVLLDNAVKYADPWTDILVHYERGCDGLYVNFKSIGTLVPDDSIECIFRRGMRGANAIGKCVGSGLGLFIAAEVVAAHEFHLSYSRKPYRDKGDYGENCFTLFIDRVYLKI